MAILSVVSKVFIHSSDWAVKDAVSAIPLQDFLGMCSIIFHLSPEFVAAAAAVTTKLHLIKRQDITYSEMSITTKYIIHRISIH